MYTYIYIYTCMCVCIYIYIYTCPHPAIPVARLLLVFLCCSVFSSIWGNPEVRGGDNLFGFYRRWRCTTAGSRARRTRCSRRPALRY